MSLPARCWDQEKLCAGVGIPALHTQTLVLVHHGINGIVLDRKSWIVCCSVHAQMVTLHTTMRGGKLHSQIFYDLLP